jgi:hypothetical protein
MAVRLPSRPTASGDLPMIDEEKIMRELKEITSQLAHIRDLWDYAVKREIGFTYELVKDIKEATRDIKTNTKPGRLSRWIREVKWDDVLGYACVITVMSASILAIRYFVLHL